MAVPIKFVGADLGRHIKNGELILHGVTDVLYKNYYSYTCGDYSIINHHWFFGVICYTLWRLVDFPGLSLIYALLIFLTFGFYFRWAQRVSSFGLACAFGLLCFPLITCRCEIRPEGLTVLFCALFWWLGLLHQKGHLRNRHLYLWIVILQVIWVNTHVFFILGPLVMVLFYLQAKVDCRQAQAKVFTIAFGWTLVACLVNPSGIAGALMPLQAFKHFGLALSEEQSAWAVLKNSPQERLIPYFLVSIPLMVLPWVGLIKKNGIKPYVSMVITMALFSWASLQCIRFISMYGYFFIPLASYAWHEYLKQESVILRKQLTITLVLAGILVSALYNSDLKKMPGLGLEPGTNASAQFFKQAGIKGPIFNDYDI